jgi:hypothetical protein
MSTLITSTIGSCNVITHNGTDLATTGELTEIIEYFDFIVQVLGIDISFEEFRLMKVDDKKAFIRDLKIKKVLN